jgi:hypothetical protein
VTEPTVPQRVVVTDFDMPIGSMMTLMIKWAIASIPAALVLLLCAAVVTAVFGALFK